MSLETHFDALKDKHADLDVAIEQESSRPIPDEVTLHYLKRRKLQLKDEMSHMAQA